MLLANCPHTDKKEKEKEKDHPSRDSNPRPLQTTPERPQKQHTSQMRSVKVAKKTGSFSLIERVILSAGAMLIFSVSFQIDQMPEGTSYYFTLNYIGRMLINGRL